MANRKISQFITETDITKVLGLAGYNTTTNIQISGSDLITSVATAVLPPVTTNGYVLTIQGGSIVWAPGGGGITVKGSDGDTPPVAIDQSGINTLEFTENFKLKYDPNDAALMIVDVEFPDTGLISFTSAYSNEINQTDGTTKINSTRNTLIIAGDQSSINNRTSGGWINASQSLAVANAIRTQLSHATTAVTEEENDVDIKFGESFDIITNKLDGNHVVGTVITKYEMPADPTSGLTYDMADIYKASSPDVTGSDSTKNISLSNKNFTLTSVGVGGDWKSSIETPDQSILFIGNPTDPFIQNLKINGGDGNVEISINNTPGPQRKNVLIDGQVKQLQDSVFDDGKSIYWPDSKIAGYLMNFLL